MNKIKEIERIYDILKEIEKISKELRKYYENNCNGMYATEEEYYSKVEPLQAKAETLAKEIGLKVYHQTDPRGVAIYLGDTKMNDTNYNRYIAI